MLQFLKTRNRTLLELWTGIIFSGIVCEVVGIVVCLLAGFNLGNYSISLWLGIVLALLSSLHLYKSIDKALDYDEKNAKAKMYRSYMLRYFVVILVFAIICFTGFFNPLVTFLGYMMLKVGALIQPITHKVYNKIFDETDPIPMTEEEYQASLNNDENEPNDTL